MNRFSSLAVAWAAASGAYGVYVAAVVFVALCLNFAAGENPMTRVVPAFLFFIFYAAVAGTVAGVLGYGVAGLQVAISSCVPGRGTSLLLGTITGSVICSIVFWSGALALDAVGGFDPDYSRPSADRTSHVEDVPWAWVVGLSVPINVATSALLTAPRRKR